VAPGRKRRTISPVRPDALGAGAYGSYDWELFYHVPLAIAMRLSKDQRFEEAQRWFHQVFDPTEPRGACWRTHPFVPADVARHREQAYQRKVVLAYLENLLAWGDAVFERDTSDATAEAAALYALAARILGPAPKKAKAPRVLLPGVLAFSALPDAQLARLRRRVRLRLRHPALRKGR
jgi:hypothetical protein